MAGKARRGVGDSGRAVAPGRAARRLALLMAAIAVVAAVLGLATWLQQSDLRDLDGLTRATATVQEHDSNRRRSDQVTLTFPTDRGEQRARVPYDGAAREGDEVEVAYVAADPSRVRTVLDWGPVHEFWAVHAALFAAFAVGLGVFGLVSRWRRGRYEVDTPVGELPQEPLGRRVVEGSLFLQGLMAGLAVLMAGVMSGFAIADEEDRVSLVVGGLGLFAFFGGFAGVVQWWYGREGVWVTDTELVARRRSRVRRWPWDQVLELGIVVDKGMATVAAARVDDGRDDGIGTDGWITLARPSSGPLSAHTWATRFRALADERELPFTEGLSGMELADSLGTTYVRRRPRTTTSTKASSDRR